MLATEKKQTLKSERMRSSIAAILGDEDPVELSVPEHTLFLVKGQWARAKIFIHQPEGRIARLEVSEIVGKSKEGCDFGSGTLYCIPGEQTSCCRMLSADIKPLLLVMFCEHNYDSLTTLMRGYDRPHRHACPPDSLHS